MTQRRPEIPPPPGDLAALLVGAARFGGRGCVRFVDRREEERALAYPEILERARRSASALEASGVRAGDRVAIVLPTCPELLDAFFGCQLLGAVPVLLYPPVRLGRLDEYFERTAEMLRACGATLLVADRRTRRLLGEVALRARPVHGVLSAESLAEGTAEGTEREAARGALDPHALAFVQFSSGTTRHPAPVALTHAQVLANVEAIVEAIPASAYIGGEACVSWLPLYHDMGLVGCLLATMRTARTLVLISPELFLARPALWLRAIARHGASVSTAPDFAYARCIEKVRDEDLEGMSLATWRIAMNGAEPVAPRTLRAFHERFAKFGLPAHALTPVYGLSEATLAVTFSDPERPFRATRFDRDALSEGVARELPADDAGGRAIERAVELAALGRPVRGFAISIRDALSGAELAPGRVGRIWARGPSVMRGYLDDRPSPIHDGWLDTGDLGFVHDGELYVCGRAKDVVVVRGRNHAPHEIERACDAVPGVRAGCAVAVSEIASEGERLLVFVEVRDDARASAPADLPARCRAAILERTGLEPSEVVVLAAGTLPRTSSGKLRRGETLRRWSRGELRPARTVTPALLAGALAKSAFAYLRAR